MPNLDTIVHACQRYEGIPKASPIFDDLCKTVVRSGWLIKLELDIMPVIILTKFGNNAKILKLECGQYL